jgi:hypothetical protein
MKMSRGFILGFLLYNVLVAWSASRNILFCLLDQVFPIPGFKPVVLSLRQPALGLNHGDPVVEEIERVHVPFLEGKSNGLFGKGSLDGKKKLCPDT